MNSIQQRSSGHCGTAAPAGTQMAAVQTGGGCCGPSQSSGGLSRFVPNWLGGSRGLIVATVFVVGMGMAFGWPALVALGAAPIILSLLPCAVMCPFGLCMMGKGRQAGSAQNSVQQIPAGDQTPALLTAEVQASPSPDAYAREPARLA